MQQDLGRHPADILPTQKEDGEAPGCQHGASVSSASGSGPGRTVDFSNLPVALRKHAQYQTSGMWVNAEWRCSHRRVEVLPPQSGGAPTAEWRCSHIRVEVLPPLGFGAERKPMLSAPPFPCAPALTLSISPPPSAPVTPPLGN